MKKKRKKSSSKVLKIIITVLALLLLIAVVIAVLKGCSIIPGNKNLSLSYDGQVLKEGDNIGEIGKTTTFTVTGADNYTVTVTARYVEENDFNFQLLSEPYTWKDVDGRDMTAGFTVEKDEEGGVFRLSYETLGSVLTQALGATVKVDDAGKADFTMTVTSSADKDNGISIDFTLFLGKIILNPVSIIF